ncbi:MAG: AAA family ATPase [Nocardioides sp.]
MTRLIHLNGPPGIGKSTLARRYADDNPGVLDCEVDLLRTLVGGWERDFAGAGALARRGALALVSEHLASGHDVVLPQLVARLSELERFEAAAEAAGADHVHVLLTADPVTAVERFHRRTLTEPWHLHARVAVEAAGGEQALVAQHRALLDLTEHRAHTVVVTSHEGDPDRTYADLLAALA